MTEENTKPGGERLRELVAGAVEATVQDEQESLEAAVLATLATVINSDVSDLKYDLLELDAGDFYYQQHQDTFAAMKALADAGELCDQVTVKDKGASWPDKTKAVPADIARTYKRRLVARANKRHALKIGQEYIRVIDAADPDDLPGLVATLQKAVFNADRVNRFIPPNRPEADLIDNFILDLKAPEPGYKTGFDRLDHLIGGLKSGVYVIAAPPSAGKTTYVKQMADQVAKNNPEVPVLFLSYEQSAVELRIKTLARLSRTANQSIREGKIDDAELERAAKQYKAFGRHLKVIEADSRHNIGAIRLLAQREKLQAGKAPVIFVDYLQIVPVVDSAQKDKRLAVDFLVSEFRRLSRELEAPIVVVSAMPRGEYKEARMSGFKESGGIEYGADIAAILSVRDENANSRDIDLVIIKNRNGPRKKIFLRYEMSYDNFIENGETDLTYLEALGMDNGK